jgi:hypothetical protein
MGQHGVDRRRLDNLPAHFKFGHRRDAGNFLDRPQTQLASFRKPNSVAAAEST